MKLLPKPGLIVSCYLHSMQGMEKILIETLWSIDLVDTFRIEGVENIEFAARLNSGHDKYIIGLIKDHDAFEKHLPYITAEPDLIKQVTDAGADMVAIDSRLYKFRNFRDRCHLEELYSVTSLPVMSDIQYKTEALEACNAGASIISTTFQERAFALTRALISEGIDNINLEGGLRNESDIAIAITSGAKWYTIGRAIHDPKTIIANLFGME